jgi:glycosyltransferase involved in cell wall biosynthesis
MPPKIKLGLYMYTSAIGGAEQYLRDLLWSLDRKRYEVTLFYEPWPAFEEFLGLDSCPQLHRQPIAVYEASQFLRNSVHLPKNLRRLRYFFNYYFWQYVWLIPNYRRLRVAFTSTTIDILHINNGGYPGAATAQLASLAARAAGIPACVMTVANTPEARRFPSKRVERWFDGRVGVAVDKFIAVSKEVGRVLAEKQRFPEEKIKTIYYGVTPGPVNLTHQDQASIRQQYGLSPANIVIGMSARLSREKGHTYLLEALAQLHSRISSRVEALIIGGGVLLDELKAQAAQLGLQQTIKFTGHLSHAEAVRAMAVCDIITLPSEIEGLPYAITEAMSLGKPVVATAVGGIPEQVIHGEMGWLIPPRNSQALAEALWNLINSPELAQQMGQKARCHYQTHFTIERMLQEHELLYQSLYRAKCKAG